MDHATFESKRTSIEIPSGRVSYVENGQGPVALFVHSVLVNGYLLAIGSQGWRINVDASLWTCWRTARAIEPGQVYY